MIYHSIIDKKRKFCVYMIEILNIMDGHQVPFYMHLIG